MEKEVVYDSYAVTIVILFIFGSTLILGTAGEAKNNGWIAIIIGLIMSLPMIYIYAKLLYLFPKKDLFDIFIMLYGKYFGRFFCILYTWYFFHLGALVIRNFAEFMNTLALPETPMMVTTMFITLIVIWSSTKGIEVLARSSRMLFIMCLTVICLIGLLSISQMSFHYLKPILDNPKDIFKGAFSTFSFPFAESIVLTGTFACLKERSSAFKALIKGLIIAGSIILFTSVRNLLILGPSSLGILYFPAYVAISRIHVGELLQRLEVSVAIVFVSSIFIKTNICLIATSNGLSKIFNLTSYKSLLIQTGLLMSYFSYIMYDSSMEMYRWATEVYKYYAFPFQVIIPIATIIVAQLRIKKLNLETS
ncbi:endospore germination permease [Clostridium sp. C8-1-8]|uniref:GerAB/ArcD/ProY family transporter n=1 Tax=Clostridium sp. C8-1-8 TaxID=2698831 RepID=UPI001369C670|nr:endospore germination permease [Clostridium sp. C8-1-8]